MATDTMTTDDLLREFRSVLPASDARALLRRASRVAGIRRGAQRGSALETMELLLILEALGAEGGPVQRVAEQLARQALQQ